MSFVSVTQQFNTTTSMGRLTLNVLLSFAQFEREVTSERIRDKIAASKRKGLWVGGMAPLGYDTKDRKITVNEAEAERVRTIFRSYLELGSLNLLMADLRKRGIVTKARDPEDRPRRSAASRSPAVRSPISCATGSTSARSVYKGEILPGEQPAIVDRDLFEAVQAKLTEQVNNHKTSRTKSRRCLIGRIFDDRGNRMTPSHARKRGIKYRYYISSALLQGQPEQAGYSQPGAGNRDRGAGRQIGAQIISTNRPTIDDADLIHDHVVRVEIQADRLVIELASAEGIRSKRKARTDNMIEVPWRKTPSTRRREILVACILAPHETPVRSVPRPARSWSPRSRAAAAGSTSSSPIANANVESIAARERLQRAPGQHDDLARLPRARSREGGHRRSPATWHRRGPPARSAGRMVPPAQRCSACSVDHGTGFIHSRSLRQETGFSAQRQRAENACQDQLPVSGDRNAAHETRQFAGYLANLRENSRFEECVVELEGLEPPTDRLWSEPPVPMKSPREIFDWTSWAGRACMRYRQDR